MSDTCGLREANGLPDALCDKDACVFWRAVGHLGEQPHEGCALEHYKLLGNHGLAEWLLSVKTRLEDVALPTQESSARDSD